jgi:hypothetical protein
LGHGFRMLVPDAASRLPTLPLGVRANGRESLPRRHALVSVGLLLKVIIDRVVGFSCSAVVLD